MSIVHGLKRTLGRSLKFYTRHLPGRMKEPQKKKTRSGPQDALGLWKKTQAPSWSRDAFTCQGTQGRNLKNRESQKNPQKASVKERLSFNMYKAKRSQNQLIKVLPK